MKYPTTKKCHSINHINTNKNRGMLLEELLNETNNYYLTNNIAVVYKKPTPIQIVKTSFSSKGIRITDAFFKEPSTTDYNGVYNGKYIDFEAKETRNKTSFPLKNIHKHQIKHMENIINNKGICFLIVYFTSLNRIYLLFAEDLIKYIASTKSSSIPISLFKEKGFIIENKLGASIDYLEIINNFGGIYETN